MPDLGRAPVRRLDLFARAFDLAQLPTREGEEGHRRLISQKIEASILTLEKSIRRSEKSERAISVAYAALNETRRKIAGVNYRVEGPRS
jgi:hypothetical protein